MSGCTDTAIKGARVRVCVCVCLCVSLTGRCPCSAARCRAVAPWCSMSHWKRVGEMVALILAPEKHTHTHTPDMSEHTGNCVFARIALAHTRK